MTGHPVEASSVVWRWGAVFSLLAAAFMTGQYVGRSSSIAGNTYRLEQVERQVDSLEAIAREIPLLLQQMKDTAEWRRDIESVRESRGVQQAQTAASIAALAQDMLSMKNAMDRIEARLEAAERRRGGAE